MAIKRLQISMFGDLILRIDDKTISQNRAGKVWLLLAYLIYHKNRRVPPEELYEVLWGDDEGSDDPQNALKALVHRARALLEQLDLNTGRDLILWRDGRYAWNTKVAYTMDVEEFDRALEAADKADADEERLTQMLRALQLYKGDLLTRLSSEAWVLPLAVHYHNLYLKTVEAALILLEGAQRLEEAAELCRAALVLEPYSDPLYAHLLQDLVDSGRHEEAVKTFEALSDRVFATFGVQPSDELRAIYREASSRTSDLALSADKINQYVQELETAPGPLCCDYDSFRLLYQANARAMVRNGDAIHIAVISVTGKDDGTMSRRVTERAVENLMEKIRNSLRSGDVAARCSVTQAIIMLPQATYENSCMVCERVTRAFRTAYPHSPAQLSYTVFPMEPANW